MVCQVVKYVLHLRVVDHLILGWMVVADPGQTHGEFSCLMGWCCSCEVREPASLISAERSVNTVTTRDRITAGN